MNKTDLITRVAENANLSRNEASEVLTTILNTISDTLKDGKKVTLLGFGTFVPNSRKPRKGRNPKTGELIDIPAKKIVKFKTGKELDQILN